MKSSIACIAFNPSCLHNCTFSLNRKQLWQISIYHGIAKRKVELPTSAASYTTTKTSKHSAKDRIHGRLTLADASDITRDGNQHSFHQVNHSVYMYCRSLQMLCPQLKELSLYFTASPHRPSHRLSGAAVHPSTQLARTARGNAVLHGGEPRGPRRVGCQRIISQARDVPPRFPHSRRRSQSV